MAVFVFMVILILFFGIISSLSQPEKGRRLSRDAELITKALTGRTDQSLLEDNKLSNEKVNQMVLNPVQYETLKKELGLTGDFCVYVEDSNGNIVPVKIKTEPGEDGVLGNEDDVPIYVNGIGSSNATVNDVRCGQPYTMKVNNG